MGVDYKLYDLKNMESFELTRSDWSKVFPYGGDGFDFDLRIKNQENLALLCEIASINSHNQDPKETDLERKSWSVNASKKIYAWAQGRRLILKNDQGDHVCIKDGKELYEGDFKQTGSLYYGGF